MYKYITVLLLANVLLLTNVKANTVIDSIGVENLNGSKLIIHQIVKNDTYYSIGRRYNVSPKEIMNFNENKYLQVGVLVKVPTKIPFTSNAGTGTGARTGSGSATSSGAGSVSTKVGVPGGNPNETTSGEHVVKPKDNLNAIARTYGTTVGEIKRINNLTSINLRIGQVLKVPAGNENSETTSAPASNSTPIPTPSPAQKAATPVISTPNKPVEQPRPILAPGSNNGAKPATTPKEMPAVKPAAEEKFVEHTVASNETIYSIATTYHMSMDQLKAKNNMQNNGLRVGQKLVISGQRPTNNQFGAADALDESDSTIKDPALRGDPSRYGLSQVDEKGTAVWITDLDLDPVKMLVLHRSAPVGAIVKVTNPMTNRSAFAKVVGKFTENESTKDVIIVMTKAVAESVGAIDKRFFCNITYSGQEHEQQQ